VLCPIAPLLFKSYVTAPAPTQIPQDKLIDSAVNGTLGQRLKRG
jgi:hypothetical protein